MSAALLLPLAALAGLALGIAHFRTLRWVSDLLIQGRLAGIGVQIARLAVLAVFLWLCARGGPSTLLAGAAGLLAGRALILRGVR